MATNVERSIHQAPAGLTLLDAEMPDVIIDIEGEETTDVPEAEPEGFDANLAESLSEADLQEIVSTLSGDVKNDLASRKDWEEMYKEGVKLLGLKLENRTEPWSGACGIFHPMITEAVVRFQADTIMETFPASGPAKAKILGEITPDTEESARRVTDDLNYQLTDNMTEFRPDHERMLFNLPSAGSAFKKIYMDPTLGRQTSVFVPAEDVIIPYGATDLQTCYRVTHRMRKTKQEVLRAQVDGFWRDIEIGDPPKGTTFTDNIQKKKDEQAGLTPINDERYTIMESCVDWNLPGYEESTGIALPYVITYVDGTNHVLSIRRNWKEGDKLKLKRQHFVHYIYIPGYGAYGFGLFHLIGGFAKGATSLLRQLVDAGTLSNLPGGLKSRGLRIKGDDTPIGPGEFRDVDLGSGAIKDNIMMLPYKEPSQVLAGLLEKIIEEGRRFAATSDTNVSDMSNQAPVGTTLAILERTLKVMTAVQARVHFAFTQELRLLAGIIEDYTDDEYDYNVDAPLGRRAKKTDFANVAIIPVSDPNAATMSQRVVQYQAVLQLSQTAPQIYDMPELHRQMLVVLGIKHVEKLIPTAQDVKAVDPVQENQNILAGKPIKAFAYQDHESHIKVHMAAMQDPLVQQLVGQNPNAQALMAAGAAHVAEHVGFAYRNKMMQAANVTLPQPKDNGDMPDVPQQTELMLSKMLADAAPQVLMQSKQIAAQMQAQQNAQDPVLIAQQIDAQTKQAEVQRKAAKDQADIQIDQQKLALDQQKLQMEAQKAGVDPQTLQAELNLKVQRQQQEMALKAKQAQEQQALQVSQHHAQTALQIQQAQERAQLEKERFAHQQAVDGTRTGTEVAATHQRMLLEQETHAQQMKLNEERHKAELVNRKKITDAGVRSAGKVKEKK